MYVGAYNRIYRERERDMLCIGVIGRERVGESKREKCKVISCVCCIFLHNNNGGRN